MVTFFHRLVDLRSARLRKFVTENALESFIQFLNVDLSERAQKELLARFDEVIAPVLKEDDRWYATDEEIKAKMDELLELKKAGD